VQVDLAVGENGILLEGVAEDGSSGVHEVSVTRGPSNNAALRVVCVEGARLVQPPGLSRRPPRARGCYQLPASAPLQLVADMIGTTGDNSATPSLPLTISGEPASSTATLAIREQHGSAAPSGGLDLSITDAFTTVVLTVTAEDGTTSREYQLTVQCRPCDPSSFPAPVVPAVPSPPAASSPPIASIWLLLVLLSATMLLCTVSICFCFRVYCIRAQARRARAAEAHTDAVRPTGAAALAALQPHLEVLGPDGCAALQLEEDPCAICLGELDPTDSDSTLIRLRCKHIFHGTCIKAPPPRTRARRLQQFEARRPRRGGSCTAASAPAVRSASAPSRRHRDTTCLRAPPCRHTIPRSAWSCSRRLPCCPASSRRKSSQGCRLPTLA
jgi:hypothetical protein